VKGFEMAGYYRSGKAIYFKNLSDADPVLIADCENEEKAHFILMTLAGRSVNFIADARVTCSPQFHGELVALHCWQNKLNDAILALQELDKVKKSLFYGADNILILDGDRNASDLPAMVGSDLATSVDIIHAILGIATEAGELLELLANTIDGEEFDWVNAQEEIGDINWYQALLAHRGNFTFEECQERIINKLRARYPDKFTEIDAINRNLRVERAILEGAALTEPVQPDPLTELHLSPAARHWPLHDEDLAQEQGTGVPPSKGLG